ncbi:putative membrane-anchored protein [Povalibacter uvarum]|uniref:Putative membrane-anchored protein n=1 Tax=Povalibacter uvarum TaxID=732238 RepID=A0A841HM75_9GAMM|nr:hypothetical protein [Povalibacter uvarum]MBB6093704.1 putative membrane-anchored protein [Povalibacter uvarum]
MTSALWVGALVILTALSAFFDAKGFVYAAQSWRDGTLSLSIALLALLYFVGGVSVYIGTIGIQHKLGVNSATLQTLFWFAMTIIGIALLDGTIAGWSTVQKSVGIAVTAGIGWLLVSAGGGH